MTRPAPTLSSLRSLSSLYALAGRLCLAGFLLPALLCAAAASPCTDQIDALDLRLRSPGAAAAEVGAAQGRGTDAATVAQGSGPRTPERFESARAALAKARSLDQAGDNKACNDALTEVKASLGPLP